MHNSGWVKDSTSLFDEGNRRRDKENHSPYRRSTGDNASFNMNMTQDISAILGPHRQQSMTSEYSYRHSLPNSGAVREIQDHRHCSAPRTSSPIRNYGSSTSLNSQGSVSGPLKVTTRTINFGYVNQDDHATRRITIQNVSSRIQVAYVKILDQTFSKPVFTVERDQLIIGPNQKAVVVVNFSPREPKVLCMKALKIWSKNAESSHNIRMFGWEGTANVEIDNSRSNKDGSQYVVMRNGQETTFTIRNMGSRHAFVVIVYNDQHSRRQKYCGEPFVLKSGRSKVVNIPYAQDDQVLIHWGEEGLRQRLEMYTKTSKQAVTIDGVEFSSLHIENSKLEQSDEFCRVCGDDRKIFESSVRTITLRFKYINIAYKASRSHQNDANLSTTADSNLSTTTSAIFDRSRARL